MKASRTYKRNKLGQFAKGGQVSMKSGNGGGSEATISTKALMSDAATTKAAFTGTKSSGSSKKKGGGASIDIALLPPGSGPSFTSEGSSKRKR